MNRLGIVAAGLVLALAAFGVAAPGPAAAAELLVNGGFESGALAPWTCSGTTGSVVSSPVRTGTRALQGAPAGQDNARCSQTVSVVSGTQYTLSGWVRGSYVYLGVNGGPSTWTPNAADWTRLTVTFTASGSTAQVYLHGWYGTGNYHADDVSLSGPGGGTPVPGTPGTPVAGTVTNTSVALSWTASSGTVTGYRVYEGGTVVATSNGTSATITGLAVCSTHTYTVAAFNGSGESARSGTVTVTTTGCGTGVPGAPSNLRVTATTSSSISLAWNASTGTVSGYRVYEGTALRTTVTGLAATLSGLAVCSSHTYSVRAFNSAGESAPATITATTAGCQQPGGLPKHLLTGYWQNFTNGATPLRLSAVPTTYDIVAVAFADANPSLPGAVTFNVDSGLSSALGGYSNAQLRADIATLHSRNQRVILSVGGERGTVSVGSSTAATNFANSMVDLINSFGFDGVDIDLENGLNPTFMEQALRSIRSRVGSNLIITMAPQTIDMQSTGMGYFTLSLNIRDILTIVHTQYYNSGGMLGCDQMFAYTQGTINFLTALACIQLQSALRPDQIALGLPASTSAAGGGHVSPAVVNNALSCLAAGTSCGSFVPPARWPSIRGAMTWSINWDASNGYAFANTVHAHLVSMP
ncbi:MAG TPA: glycosyl hydrolase family 18 protein [Candidatus Limnocylindrales bacterium]